jgi:hypothetical protein
VHEGTWSCSAQADTAGELACGNRAQRGEVLASLSELPRVPVCTSWPPQSWQRFPLGAAACAQHRVHRMVRVSLNPFVRRRRVALGRIRHNRDSNRRVQRGLIGRRSRDPDACQVSTLAIAALYIAVAQRRGCLLAEAMRSREISCAAAQTQQPGSTLRFYGLVFDDNGTLRTDCSQVSARTGNDPERIGPFVE